MDALILCSGFAKRLEPLSEFVPKPLLYIDQEPLIDHIIDRIGNVGVDRIVVTTNRRFSPQFRYWMKSQAAVRRKQIELLVEPTVDHEEKFGAIKSIDYALRNAGMRDDTLLLAGDNYFDFDLSPLVGSMHERGKPVIALYDVKSYEDAKMFGVVQVDGRGSITEFEEKPERPKSTLVSTAIYAYPKEYLHLFGAYLKEGGSPDGIGHFLEWLIRKDTVYGHVYSTGSWFDIGTLTTYRKLFYRYM